MSYSQAMLNAIESGKMDEAKKNFAWALRKDDDETIYNLAEQLYGLGFVNQAQRAYLKLLDKYPDEDEIRTSLAEIAIDNGDNDEALSYLNQVKEDSPAYLNALLVAADLYQTEGQFEVCESKLMEAYKIAPEEPAVLFALGEFYYLIDKFDKAIPYYFALIQQGYAEFAKVDIAGRLGMCYAESGDFEKALAYLKQVTPEYQTSNIRFQTAVCELRLGKLKDAKDTLEGLIKDDKDYASAYPALADVYLAEHDDESALKTMQEGLGVDQYNEQMYAKAAEIASHMGDSDLMAKYLKKAHELAPDNLTITLQYSNFLLDQGDHKANLELLNGVNDEDSDPQVDWNKAKSLQATEDYKAAQEAYERALPAFDNNATFMKELVGFYREAGQPDKMMRTLEAYLDLEPDDPEMNDLYNDYL